MLCHTCEPFLTDLLNEDFVNWRHVKPGWYTYRHGDYATIEAAAEAGCQICRLFNGVRRRRIAGLDELSEKWLVQTASIDYLRGYDGTYGRPSDSFPAEARSRWTFNLLTVLPTMSWIKFEVFDPKVSSRRAGDSKDHSTVPHAVGSSAISPAAMQAATSWLHECTTSHSHCGTGVLAALPTRVIDIERSGDMFNLRLQVDEGHRGRYVTLSHCWGSKSRLVLTSDNLGDFKESIPFDQLPPTFADAVRLTASLGQRYLWIDALCILQGDDDDWRKEAATMCAVFENALFSISALNAEDSHSGLLQERQIPQVVVNIAGSQLGVRERLPSLEEALQQSKLETRAWCLQERLLAPRILHVAPGQLHWECRTYVMSETTPNQPLENDPGQASRPFTATSKRPAALAKKVDDHHAHWLELVAGYSSRDLTKPSDRLPAISGLAEKAKRELGLGIYAYGLWLDDMPAGLLWRCEPRRQRSGEGEGGKKESDMPVSPTWSWASSRNAVQYPTLDDGFAHLPTKSDMVLKRRHPDDTRVYRDASAGSLSILGMIKRGSCKVTTKSPALGEAVFKASGSLLSDGGLACFLDAGEEPVPKGCYCLLIGVFEQVSKPKQPSKGAQRSCYLILERAQDDDSPKTMLADTFGIFRRIGMGFDSPSKVDSVFANAERRSVELV